MIRKSFAMQTLNEVYKRLDKAKKKRKELNKMLKDELSANVRYQEIQEEAKALREEKKGIEMEIRSGSGELSELDELKIEISTDQELISDIALNMYVNKETVEIVDENDEKWYPQFKVTFKKE
ncbi:TPA: hypothetical protein DDZ10_04140 [Candidatus Uhrbacteria bacterium]|uniref:Uncharacterized protein n=1 Tax=Candidatus Uhrbacteria bacterium GW2011_GWC2_53_7 TaxID=1618986 RepID=A0A0G1XUB7_9BACT|nr:MAG: hypothetical protein UY82_C0066G0004 [Candidatus Uhrbacteria bacterium GW2011_GWC2_53_7]HBL39829.1 hypothetical protein [Candidatus Uhrbacteria bacterium]